MSAEKWIVTNLPKPQRILDVLSSPADSECPVCFPIMVTDTDKLKSLPFPINVMANDIWLGRVKTEIDEKWLIVAYFKGEVENCSQLTNGNGLSARVEVSFKLGEETGSLKILEIK